jgi:hypothetical protein
MRTRSFLLLCLATLFAFGLACGPARAHDVPPSVVMLDLGRTAISAELQLPLSELGSALSLPLAEHAATVVEQHGPRIAAYVGQWLRASTADGRPYALHVDAVSRETTSNVNWTSNEWVHVHVSLTPPEGAETEALTLDDQVIVQRVLSHQILVYVRKDLRHGVVGDAPVAIGTAGFGSTRVTIDGRGGSWWQGFGRLFSLGLHHIAEGPDHLLFLLALLLPAPLLARAGRWREAAPGRVAARRIVTVVSGFTLGHSLSLAAAATALVAAPTRAVEALIAVSILVSCVHAWRPLFAGRELWIATGFGLVHGLAFAETLMGLRFDATTLAVSLLGFNLGIEAMQLIVIAATLPTLLLLARTRAHTAVRVGGAAFAAACAAGWLGERAFGLRNPLQAVSDWLSPPPLWFALALGLASAASLAVLAWRAHRPGAARQVLTSAC